LGGALSQTSQWLIPVITSALQSNILPPLRSAIRIEASAQGENACLLGAIALVLDDILREPLNSI
jgi:predicted NBD/HSP70 family sugar kinase